MLLLTFVIIVFYILVLGSLIYGFDKVSEQQLSDRNPQTQFSILIPFRNESEQLPLLLKSILDLNYPRSLFEIIFIDDNSTDNSVELIVKQLENSDVGHQIITLSHATTSPKKEAITKAVGLAKFDWIITTDADCIVPKYWLDCYNDLIQKTQATCITGPVTYTEVHSFFKRFQLLDFLSLQGATIGGFGLRKAFLCNGANFAYKKVLFTELQGFEGNAKIASGDDVFLLQKASKSKKEEVFYLKYKEAIVTTKAQANFKELISQRIRWAAKASHYYTFYGKFVGFVVLLMNALLACTPFLVIGGVMTIKTLLYIAIIKFGVDFLMLFKTSRFFDQERFLSSFFTAAIGYPLFATYVAILSFFKGYSWKGRTYSK